MSDTLILTPDYQPADFLPLSVVDWQTCIRLLCLGKIQPVHLYENRWISSPRLKIQLPSVAVTTEHFAFKKGRVRFSRQLLFLRDLYQCAYCENIFHHKNLTVDHVVPRCEGGKTTWTNTVAACSACNLKKGNKRWTPRFHPYAPTYYQLAEKRLNTPLIVHHPSWIPYLKVGKTTANKVSIR